MNNFREYTANSRLCIILHLRLLPKFKGWLYQLITFFFLVCQGQELFAQEKISDRSFEYFCTFGVSKRIFLVNPKYQSENPDFNPHEYAAMVKKSDQLGFTSQLGVLMSTIRSEKVAIQSGLLFNSFGRKNEYDFPDRVSHADTITYQIVHQVSRFSDFYIGVPLGIQIEILKGKKGEFYVRTGLRLDFYLASSEMKRIISDYSTIVDIEFRRSDEYRPVCLVPYLGVGKEWEINSKCNLTTTFLGNFQLLSAYDSNNPFTQRWYSSGIAIGIKY